MEDKEKFAVITISKSKETFSHWSDELTMMIQKGDVVLKLESEEIIQLVKSLPKTIGGKY